MSSKFTQLCLKGYVGIKNKADYIPLFIMCILVSLTMFFRGLYFEADRAFFGIFAFLFIGLIFLCTKKKIFVSSYADIFILALTLLYAIVILPSYNKNSSISAFSSYVLLLVIYYATKLSCDKEDKIRILITTFSLAIAATSAISLLTATGAVNYPMAYSTSEIERWLNGTVQYHNAFGILAVCGFFALSGVYRKSRKDALYWVNLAAYYVLMFGVIMSYSRGAWVMVPFAFIVYMLMGDKNSRVKLLWSGLSSLVAVLSVFSPFTSAVIANDTKKALIWLFAGLVIMFLIGVLFDIVLGIVKDKKYFSLTVFIIGGAVVALALVIVLFPSAFSSVLPETLVERLKGINLGSATVVERFVFYKDAFNLSKKSLLFGLGGGAWAELYGMYQSYNYASSQAHSYFMQILVETGILGLGAFLGIIVSLIVYGVKLRKNQSLSNSTLAGLYGALTALVLHSLIDFDLSIFAISVILWGIFGIITSQINDFKGKSILKYVSLIVCVVMCVFMLCNFISEKAEAKGDTAFSDLMAIEQSGETVKPKTYLKAYKEYNLAANLKPYDSVVLSKKAKAGMYSNYENKNQREKMVALYEKAEKNAPYNMQVLDNGTLMFARVGAYPYAVTCYKKMVEAYPLNVDLYLIYLQNAYDIMNYYRGEGIMNTAGKISKEALEVEELAKTHNVELPEETKPYFDLFAVVYNNTIRGTEEE